MNYIFRKAENSDAGAIWQILQQGILRRRREGSQQWQDGYPNPAVVQHDIDQGYGYVLTLEDQLVGYAALLINDEPAYNAIRGAWLSAGSFVVFHRLAIAAEYSGKGLAQIILREIEAFAIRKGIRSVRADTNFDNEAMLRSFQKSGYTCCGEIMLRGAARKAFEKWLPPHSL